MLLLLVACAQPDACEGVTWETFGDGFVRSYCQTCHATTSPDRHGAPADVTFDNEDQTLAWEDSVVETVRGGLMPPGGGITETDMEMFECWLGGGALAE
jgi:uncharacterized membrane protein